MSKPRIAITLGDPAGIGYEITIRAVNSLEVQRVCSPVLFGDKKVFDKYKSKIKKSFDFVESSNITRKVKIGEPSRESGTVALEAIKKAVDFCLQKKTFALVTAPVSKESLKLANVKFPGHTELLAYLTNSKNVEMMMACGNICGIMVTRHIPLSKVPLNIKTKDIVKTVKTGVEFLKKYKKNVKVALCALNPHAGDNGILGSEEKKYIYPAYKSLKKQHINVSEPLPADSAWLKTKNGEFDLICGMYHDQIMIPLKCIDAKKIVNVTAGLPFIRTSPGHGTAFDIAGRNIADASSMIEAIKYAVKILKTDEYN